ncbi:MAG: ketose-bisphosphate aldolase [Planctomycetaceae bacterium]
MPVATPKQYAAMLDSALKGGYAYPAINITSIIGINGALKAFSDMKSDGIIQVSTGAGEFASGQNVKDAVLGSVVLAEAVHALAAKHNVMVALHTDHCQPGWKDSYCKNWLKAKCAELKIEMPADGSLPEALAAKKEYSWIKDKSLASGKVDKFLKPLIEETAKRRAAGRGNLFQSHMLDASNLPLDMNMGLSKEIIKLCAANEIVLEVEAGVVGGVEEGMDNTGVDHSKLYTTTEDMVEVYESLANLGPFMFAATFGNVHGHYKPGAVKLQPKILKDGQEAVMKKHGDKARMHLVFHGGSGTPRHEIEETLNYGVVKMNIDTDTQYAFTRPIADFMFKNYDGVVKVDDGIGDKAKYDPRAYLKLAEVGVAQRLAVACDDLHSTGKTLFGQI